MTWLAIRTEPGRLPAVRQILRRAGHDVYLPAEIRLNHRRRKRTVVPVMPYLFVKSPAQEVKALWMQQVLSTRYVKTFVMMGGQPAPVYDAAIDLLRKSIKDFRFEQKAKSASRKISPGAKVRHKNGKVGTVVWTNKRRLKWETVLFGRVVTVESAMDQVEIAA